MFITILRKSLPNPQTHLGLLLLLRCKPSPSAIARPRSFTTETANPNPFKVSYLIDSCGSSPESPNSVSDNAQSVLNLLRNHKFSETQISKLVKTYPTILNCNSKTNLLPKLQFFRSSVGLSDEDLAQILSSTPSLLASSLEEHLIPRYNFFNNVIGLDKKQVIVALKRRPRAFLCNVEQSMAPNIAYLRELGVPQSSITYFVSVLFKRAFIEHSRFIEVVEEAVEMGFDPSELPFVVALHTLPAMTESKWNSKFKFFGNWGWSRDDTLVAFRNDPRIVEVSEEKVEEVMDFLVEEMGWSSAPRDIVREPKVLFYSFEKRIVPRCCVVGVLKMKGLVKEDISLTSFVSVVERIFLERYVVRFEDSVPELLSLYRGNMNPQDIRRRRRSKLEKEEEDCSY